MSICHFQHLSQRALASEAGTAAMMKRWSYLGSVKLDQRLNNKAVSHFRVLLSKVYFGRPDRHDGHRGNDGCRF